MLLLIWFTLCVVAASVILLPLALWLREIYKRYSDSRPVECPENKQAAAVSIDALHAVATGVDGRPDLRLCDCTRWPERANCNQACLSQAVQAGKNMPVEVKVGTKQIYHLPILLAASVAWYLGIIWHSQYLFRTQWIDAIGLNHAQVKQIVSLYLPHLLTAAICLLFAYGVAWLLAVCHRKGVLHGVLMSVLLCVAVVAASWFGIARLPHDLLVIEAGYTVLATITVGAIVGGWYNKLVLPSH